MVTETVMLEMLIPVSNKSPRSISETLSIFSDTHTWIATAARRRLRYALIGYGCRKVHLRCNRRQKRRRDRIHIRCLFPKFGNNVPPLALRALFARWRVNAS
jgi:hypothetical protein